MRLIYLFTFTFYLACLSFSTSTFTQNCFPLKLFLHFENKSSYSYCLIILQDIVTNFYFKAAFQEADTLTRIFATPAVKSECMKSVVNINRQQHKEEFMKLQKLLT